MKSRKLVTSGEAYKKVLIFKRLIRGGNPSGEALSDNVAGVLAFQDLRCMALLVGTAPSSTLLLRHEIDDIPLCVFFFMIKEVSLVVEIQGLCRGKGSCLELR